MKNFTFGVRASILALTTALLLSVGAPSQAQAGRNLSSQQLALNRAGEALDRVVLTAKKVNSKLGYGFFETGCVFGVMLKPGASASEGFTLTAGQSYVFIGGGDKSTRNVDIFLRDSSGRTVIQDTEQDAAPFVLFKPKKTGRYKMYLRLASSRSGTAFCAVTILRKGGYDVPIERLAQAIVKAAAASTLIFRGVNGGRFSQDPDTWALYGAVLKPKQTVTSDPKRYHAANRGFIGVGDDRVKDLDLLVLNSKNQVVASDTKNGAAAGVAYKTAQGTYSIGLANNSSNGPALVMGLIMELPAGLKINTANQTKPTTGATGTTNGRRSPFLGSWSGDWQDGGNRQEGGFEMNVRADGTMTGNVINSTVNVTSPIRGLVQPNGVFAFTYSYQGQNYIAKGTMRFTNNDDADIQGQVTFTANGRAFGNADFSLDKDF